MFLECVHCDDRARVDKALRDAAEDVQPYDEIFRIACPDGSVRWVHSKGEVTRNPEGKPSLVFGTSLDITERKQMEESYASLMTSLSSGWPTERQSLQGLQRL